MSEKRGPLPNKKNMDRDFEVECVAAGRPKRDEVMGRWAQLYNKEIHNLFLSAKYC
jgi:hypothetical protein